MSGVFIKGVLTQITRAGQTGFHAGNEAFIASTLNLYY